MRIAACFTALLTLAGCRTGYQRSADGWTWVSYNAAVGKSETSLGADPATFAVLDKDFARDRRTVWFLGSRVPDADAGSFETLGGGYGRDRNHVYYGKVAVYQADPLTFERLGFPYSRDRHSVYSGTVPLELDDPSTFRVVRGGASTLESRVDLTSYPGLSEALLARGLPPDLVFIAGMDGVGQAGNQRFEGALAVPAP